MRQNKCLIKRDGFTFIEVLIAMAILSIGILALYTMTISIIKGNANAQSITVSSAAFSDQIEKIMALSYDDSLLSVGTHTLTSNLPLGISSYSWTVSEWSNDNVDNDGDTKIDEYDERGIKNIVFTVTYKVYGSQKSHSVQLIKAEIFK